MNNAIIYAGGIGLVGGLAVGVRDVRKRRREEIELNLTFRQPDRDSRNPYREDSLLN